MKINEDDIAKESLELIDNLSQKGYTIGNVGYLINILIEYTYRIEPRKEEYQAFLMDVVNKLDE